MSSETHPRRLVRRWKPQSTQNWLKHWEGKLEPPAGAGKQPVTWVSFDDANAYCTAQGKRLPHSAEWQLAAQGTDGALSMHHCTQQQH